MRWLKIGDRIHAVTRKHDGRTLCGLAIERMKHIAQPPGFENRCGSCDNEWRHRGRATKPKTVKKVDTKTVYRPRLKFDDFDYESDPRWEDPFEMDDYNPTGGPP